MLNIRTPLTRTGTLRALFFCFALLGIGDVHSMGPPRYSFLGGWNSSGSPVWLQTSYRSDDLGRLMWYRSKNLRLQIVEHQQGPLAFILATIVSVGGTLWLKGGDGKWYSDNMGLSVGEGSVLTFDISKEYWSLRGESWWSRSMGFALALHSLREIEANKQAFQLSDTASGTYRFLRKENALYVENGASGGDIDLMLRYRYLATSWITSEFKLDAPIVYMLCAPIVFFGGFDENAMGTIYTFGVPRLHSQTSLFLGPVTLRGTIAVPTRFLAVPWYTEAIEFSATAGLCF